MTYTYFTHQAQCWKDVEYLQEYDCLKKKKDNKEWLNKSPVPVFKNIMNWLQFVTIKCVL